jgi:hypothetical protein
LGLDVATANELSSILTGLEAKIEAAKLVSNSFCILWVADDVGQIWVAIEELVSKLDSGYRVPLLRQLDIPDGFLKLGHPSLLPRIAGRIGGELMFDDESDPKWVLTNKSGRYGINRGRTLQELDKAAEIFKSLGIAVGTHHI